MADPRPWPPPEVLDTPRRRLNRALLRDFALVLPWLVVVVTASVAIGRWAGWAVFVAILAVRTIRVAATGMTTSMRRAGIRFVRLGTAGPPGRWRLALSQLVPFLLVGAVLVAGRSVPFAFPVAIVAYLALGVIGEVRARRAGFDVDGTLALAGLDVWWSGDPPTPSGTSERPAPGPPPPTPPAPPTPAPAPRPGRRGRR